MFFFFPIRVSILSIFLDFGPNPVFFTVYIIIEKKKKVFLHFSFRSTLKLKKLINW